MYERASLLLACAFCMQASLLSAQSPPLWPTRSQQILALPTCVSVRWTWDLAECVSPRPHWDSLISCCCVGCLRSQVSLRTPWGPGRVPKRDSCFPLLFTFLPARLLTEPRGDNICKDRKSGWVTEQGVKPGRSRNGVLRGHMRVLTPAAGYKIIAGG